MSDAPVTPSTPLQALMAGVKWNDLEAGVFSRTLTGAADLIETREEAELFAAIVRSRSEHSRMAEPGRGAHVTEPTIPALRRLSDRVYESAQAEDPALFDRLTEQVMPSVLDLIDQVEVGWPRSVARLREYKVDWTRVTDGGAREILVKAAAAITDMDSVRWFTHACRAAATQPRERWEVTAPAFRTVGRRAGLPLDSPHRLGLEEAFAVRDLVITAREAMLSPAGVANVLNGAVHWEWLEGDTSAAVLEAAAQQILTTPDHDVQANQADRLHLAMRDCVQVHGYEVAERMLAVQGLHPIDASHSSVRPHIRPRSSRTGVGRGLD